MRPWTSLQDPDRDSGKTVRNVLKLWYVRETSISEAGRVCKRAGVYSSVYFSFISDSEKYSSLVVTLIQEPLPVTFVSVSVGYVAEFPRQVVVEIKNTLLAFYVN